jgi:phosphotriesterase-related protein
MPYLSTTLGPKTAADVGFILPHEHIFVDLRTWDQPGYGEGRAEDVLALMAPEVEKARAGGVTALVECSPLGVGRRVDLLKAFSLATGFPLVVPTGVYREPWIPLWIYVVGEDELVDWMQRELVEGIEETGVLAGFVKLSAGDDGITACETKVLRAAARAARPLNAVIGSHTVRGRVLRDQLDIVEAAGYSPTRFIWIHAQNEPDFSRNLEMARRGAWIEYDAISRPERDDFFIERILAMLEAGFASQLLLSHDNGWYDPGKPNGGTPRPFTYLGEVFLPKLRQRGVPEELIQQLTVANPFSAFARF